MESQFVAFLAVAALLIVTPGPDMALVLRNALVGGGGFFTGLGVCAGQMVWIVATCLGITALLVASEPVFLVVKLFGAAYLIYLGIQALISVFRRIDFEPDRTEPIEMNRSSSLISFRQGLISNLGNPKMAVFFTSILPQFAPGGGSSFFGLLLFGTVFCLLTLIWLTCYSAFVGRTGDFLRRPRIRRAVESVTGAVLVALGLRLATETR